MMNPEFNAFVLEAIKKRYNDVTLLDYYSNFLKNLEFHNFLGHIKSDRKLINDCLNLFYFAQVSIENIVYNGSVHPNDLNACFTLFSLIETLIDTEEESNPFSEALFALNSPTAEVPPKLFCTARVSLWCKVIIPTKIFEREDVNEKEALEWVLKTVYGEHPECTAAREWNGHFGEVGERVKSKLAEIYLNEK